MFPDWLPDTTPIRLPADRRCTDCSEPLTAGRLYRCRSCTEAAHQAIREAKGATVRPSDVARIRERVRES